MAGECRIERRESQRAAVIRRKAPADQIGASIVPLFGELYQWLGRKGLQPVGMPFMRFYAMDEREMDSEAGAPFAGEASGDGRVQVGELPGGEIAVTVFAGPYDQLRPVHETLQEWIREQGREPRDHPWEAYLTDPNTEPDPAKWLTEVCYPV